MSRRNYSLRSYYEDIEREAMGELNPIRYHIKKYAVVTVDKYGYVRLREDTHYYSVPHTLIGSKLRLTYTSTEVEIYDNYECVDTHPRDRTEFHYTLNSDHLCPKHKTLIDWHPETFIAQAAVIDADVEYYIRKVLENKRHIDQASKSCSGILNLARKVGGDRLVAVCQLADSYGRYNYLQIEDILNKNAEQLEPTEQTADMPEHENIRGREYNK